MVKSHAFLLDPKKVMRPFKLGLIGFMVAGTGFYHFEKPKKRFVIKLFKGLIFVFFKLRVQFVSCNINDFCIYTFSNTDSILKKNETNCILEGSKGSRSAG